MNQAPTDVHGMRNVESLRNTSYRERPNENLEKFGKKLVDESKIVQKVSTYNRTEMNKEERSFGGRDQNQTTMNFKSSRVEYPVETHNTNFREGNLEANLTVNDKSGLLDQSGTQFRTSGNRGGNQGYTTTHHSTSYRTSSGNQGQGQGYTTSYGNQGQGQNVRTSYSNQGQG